MGKKSEEGGQIMTKIKTDKKRPPQQSAASEGSSTSYYIPVYNLIGQLMQVGAMSSFMAEAVAGLLEKGGRQTDATVFGARLMCLQIQEEIERIGGQLKIFMKRVEMDGKEWKQKGGKHEE